MSGSDPHDPAVAVSAQYARRDPACDAQRYSLFDAAALQAQQERLREMLALWRTHGWQTLSGRRITEVGCGSGGNLLDLLRLGASAECLTGIELLTDRVAAARACLPAALRLVEGDAATQSVESDSQDAVLAFTVFSSLLEDGTQERLAEAIWNWTKPGGGVLWYDFVFDNPGNPDVRGVSMRRLRELFPVAHLTVRRITLAPPLARALARAHPGLVRALAPCLPFLKSHRLVWARKP